MAGDRFFPLVAVSVTPLSCLLSSRASVSFAVSIAQTFLIIPHSRDPRSFKYDTKYHQAMWSGHQGGAKAWYNYRCSESILYLPTAESFGFTYELYSQSGGHTFVQMLSLDSVGLARWMSVQTGLFFIQAHIVCAALRFESGSRVDELITRIRKHQGLKVDPINFSGVRVYLLTLGMLVIDFAGDPSSGGILRQAVINHGSLITTNSSRVVTGDKISLH
jgi:hypothetical protein